MTSHSRNHTPTVAYSTLNINTTPRPLLSMLLRQRVKKFRKHVTSRLGLDALLSNTTQSSISVTNVPNRSTTPSGGSMSVRSEINGLKLAQNDTASLAGRGSVNPPTLLPTRATSEVTLPSQRTDTSDSGNTQPQSVFSHAPVATPIPGTARLVASARRASMGGWAALKTFMMALDQSASMFGPLKVVVNELVRCINIYDVSASIPFCMMPRIRHLLMCFRAWRKAVTSSRHSKKSSKDFSRTFNGTFLSTHH